MAVRIICVGNRLVGEDSLGPRVYDRLSDRPLPAGVEAVDGGLQGLNLVRVVDGADGVVFVDALAGFAAPGRVVVLAGDEAVASARGALDHAAGLAYLLKALPVACDAAPPPWSLVGAEGTPDDELVAAVAERALAVALEHRA